LASKAENEKGHPQGCAATDFCSEFSNSFPSRKDYMKEKPWKASSCFSASRLITGSILWAVGKEGRRPREDRRNSKAPWIVLSNDSSLTSTGGDSPFPLLSTSFFRPLRGCSSSPMGSVEITRQCLIRESLGCSKQRGRSHHMQLCASRFR
jgi:hypothetical protein